MDKNNCLKTDGKDQPQRRRILHNPHSQNSSPVHNAATPAPSSGSSLPPSNTASQRYTPYYSRMLAADEHRRQYVASGLRQIDKQISAASRGDPVPPLDASAVDFTRFRQESSNEDAIQRFCIRDWAETPAATFARTVLAEQEQTHQETSVQQQHEQQGRSEEMEDETERVEMAPGRENSAVYPNAFVGFGRRASYILEGLDFILFAVSFASSSEKQGHGQACLRVIGLESFERFSVVP
ncbi:hypothetical protein RUND412_004089 [Rhizina undulata]